MTAAASVVSVCLLLICIFEFTKSSEPNVRDQLNMRDHPNARDQLRKVKHCPDKRQQVFLDDNFEKRVITLGKEYKAADCKTSWELLIDKERNDLRQFQIKVEVTYTKLSCSAASLRISDGHKSRSFCSTAEEGVQKQTFYSTDDRATISFSTAKNCNSELECDIGEVTFTVFRVYVCGGAFEVTETHTSGSITSPFYPYNYDADTSCIYDISAPDSRRLQLSCSDFNLSEKCKKGSCRRQSGARDFLQDFRTFRYYEGKMAQGKTFISKDNHMDLWFFSNTFQLPRREKKYGFNCTYALL